MLTGQYLKSQDRRRSEYKRMGWVYVMRNPALRDPVFKVGQTRRWPWERADDLTRSTGVYGEFSLVYFVHVSDRTAAEAHAHEILREHRVMQGKEFFQAPLPKVLKALDAASAMWPVWVGARKPAILPQVFRLQRTACNSCGAVTAVRELLIAVRPRCSGCHCTLG
jgi:hypothetical protein